MSDEATTPPAPTVDLATLQARLGQLLANQAAAAVKSPPTPADVIPAIAAAAQLAPSPAPVTRGRTNLGRRCLYTVDKVTVVAIVVYEYTDADLLTVDAQGASQRLAAAGMVDLVAFPRHAMPAPVSSVHIADNDWLD